MTKKYAEKFKEKCSTKTKEQLQIIIVEAEKNLDTSKLLSPYFTIVGLLISLIVFQFSNSSNKNEFVLSTTIAELTSLILLLIIFLYLIIILSGRASVRKRSAEFELISREKESAALESRNKKREDRLKAKYLSKR